MSYLTPVPDPAPTDTPADTVENVNGQTAMASVRDDTLVMGMGGVRPKVEVVALKGATELPTMLRLLKGSDVVLMVTGTVSDGSEADKVDKHGFVSATRRMSVKVESVRVVSAEHEAMGGQYVDDGKRVVVESGGAEIVPGDACCYACGGEATQEVEDADGTTVYACDTHAASVDAHEGEVVDEEQPAVAPVPDPEEDPEDAGDGGEPEAAAAPPPEVDPALAVETLADGTVIDPTTGEVLSAGSEEEEPAAPAQLPAPLGAIIGKPETYTEENLQRLNKVDLGQIVCQVTAAEYVPSSWSKVKLIETILSSLRDPADDAGTADAAAPLDLAPDPAPTAGYTREGLEAMTRRQVLDAAADVGVTKVAGVSRGTLIESILKAQGGGE